VVHGREGWHTRSILNAWVGKIVSVDFKRHSDALQNELAEQLCAEMQVQVDILTYKFRATAFAVVWNCSIITLVRPPCTWAVEARKQSEAWNIRRYSLTKSSNGQDNGGLETCAAAAGPRDVILT
jgi:hypothetical protein